VRSAAIASSHPFTFYLGYPLIPEGYADGDDLVTRVRLVGNDYFPTVGARLLDGRFLDEKDGMQAAVINESLAVEHFPDGRAVGKRIRLGDLEGEPWRTVVGVVADVDYYGRPDSWTTAVYLPSTGVDYPFEMTPLIRAEGEPLALADAIRERVASVDPRVPVGRMTRLDDVLNGNLSVPRLRTTLLGAFGAVALLLSAIGLYGVMAFWVAERRREMGVRLALGADRGRIVRQVLGHGLALVALGIGIGLLLSWPAFGLLHSQIPDLLPWQPLLQGVAIGVLVLAALFACWLPARRAAGVDPMVVLREE
jgi:putative ABC transport system permease protein